MAPNTVISCVLRKFTANQVEYPVLTMLRLERAELQNWNGGGIVSNDKWRRWPGRQLPLQRCIGRFSPLRDRGADVGSSAEKTS